MKIVNELIDEQIQDWDTKGVSLEKLIINAIDLLSNIHMLSLYHDYIARDAKYAEDIVRNAALSDDYDIFMNNHLDGIERAVYIALDERRLMAYDCDSSGAMIKAYNPVQAAFFNRYIT